jgi:uridine kinase
MLVIPDPYSVVVDKLIPLLHDLPGILIAIDGKNGSGKTTLGRYLSWTFNISLIETDLFRLPAKGDIKYREYEIFRIIKYRLNMPRPVIVEGVVVQRLLKNMNLKSDFAIYIVNEAYDRDNWLGEILAKYEGDFKPKDNANLVIELDVI